MVAALIGLVLGLVVLAMMGRVEKWRPPSGAATRDRESKP